MQKLNSMENQKKTYLKPAIRVEEWDFNEAICQNQAVMCSPRTMCITINNGTHLDNVENRNFEGDASKWGRLSE